MPQKFTDHLGRSVELNGLPQRIVSLCPSQTEALFDLGLGDRIVGCTRYCVHPPEAKSKALVGGTKDADLAAILALKPDLVIAEKEENKKETIEALAQHVPVFVTDVSDDQSAVRMVRDLAALCGQRVEGELIARSLEAAYAELKAIKRSSAPRVAYLIWKKPYMAAGSGTYIHALLQICGFENVFACQTRYPEVTEEILKREAPELVFLSSEPYPFETKHQREIEGFLKTQTQLVDGEAFSWYGTRLLKVLPYLKEFART